MQADACGDESDAGPRRPSVAVVVPGRNDAHLIGEQLEALAPQVEALGGEIVVVDDASVDGSGNVAAAWAAARPEVACTVLASSQRRFGNASRNAGVLASSAPVLAFADGDDLVADGWLAALTGAVAPGVIATGRALDPRSGSVNPPPGFYGIDLATVFCGSMAFERTLFDAVGGFDERIEDGGTETEWAFAAQMLHGARVVVVPDAAIRYHQPLDRADQRRRSVRQQRGHAVIARRLAAGGIRIAAFTVPGALRSLGAAAVRTVAGGGRGRAAEVDRMVVALAALGWSARMAVVTPEPLRADPGRSAAHYTVRHPR